MTKLSLFLYAADALDSISDFCIAFGVIAIVIFVIFGIANIASWTVTGSCDDEECSQWVRAHSKRTLIIPILAMFFFFGVSTLIPEKKTMYMIAGVEMADMFRQTDTAEELSKEMKSVLTDITSIIHSYAHEKGANNQKEAE
jgi:uncharacterized membrane protein YjgN (DUF898 family)